MSPRRSERARKLRPRTARLFSPKLAGWLVILSATLPTWAQPSWSYGTNVISAASGVSLGLGTSSPADVLHIVGGNIRLDSGHAIQLSGGTGNSFIVKDTSNNILRMLNFQASWNDSTLSSFFQMGQSAGLFTGVSGNTLSRFGIMSAGTLITDSFYQSAPPPVSLFHLYSSANHAILTNQAAAAGLISTFRDKNDNGDTFDFRLNGTGLASEPAAGQIGISTLKPIEFFQSGMERMRIDVAGNVGIGTSAPQYKLAVKGTIGATEVVVTTTGWSDYVFQPGYALMPLSHVASYIEQNHHLPDIPSAAEVQSSGISVGEMQAKLLAKIEELTLHMINAEKRSNELQTENDRLQKRIVRLESSAESVK